MQKLLALAIAVVLAVAVAAGIGIANTIQKPREEIKVEAPQPAGEQARNQAIQYVHPLLSVKRAHSTEGEGWVPVNVTDHMLDSAPKLKELMLKTDNTYEAIRCVLGPCKVFDVVTAPISDQERGVLMSMLNPRLDYERDWVDGTIERAHGVYVDYGGNRYLVSIFTLWFKP